MTSAKAGLSIALLDPGSLLARDVRALLQERAFPAVRTDLFHTRPGSSGLLADDEGEAAYVAPVQADSLSGCTFAFACGEPADLEAFLARRSAGDGALLVDLTGRSAPAGKGTAEGAPESLASVDDPVAAAAAAVVGSLDRLSSVASLAVALDRPASELGKPALDELMAQAIALASFQPVPTEVLRAQLAFNFLHPADSAAFEARFAADLASLLRADLPVDVASSRSGAFHGHHVRLTIRFHADAPGVEAARRAVVSGAGFASTHEGDVPALTTAAGRDEPILLRMSARDRSIGVSFAIDHLRTRALAGVRLAERTLATRGL